MSLPQFSTTDQRWNILQEGAVPNNASSPYLLLLSALDLGWSVRPPIRQYPNPIYPPQAYYHITLVRNAGRQKRELALPHSPELEQYLAGEHIEVKMKR